eukprot:COSAG02_NODE_965_length_15584_cov_21.604312_9_plen_67_part_00
MSCLPVLFGVLLTPLFHPYGLIGLFQKKFNVALREGMYGCILSVRIFDQITMACLLSNRAGVSTMA